MPQILSQCRVPWYLRGGHVQTLYPHLRRSVPKLPYIRERLELPDGDFLDLDWFQQGHGRLMIALHGLEGSSQSTYIRGLLLAASEQGWDCLAVNWRSCSGVPNRLPRFYHSGATEDLAAVMDHLLDLDLYGRMGCAGFSLGGNVLLRYLGEQGEKIPLTLTHGAAVSVPCDLSSSARRLDSPGNGLYRAHFLRSLRRKVRSKPDQMAGFPAPGKLRKLVDFDNAYTAPLHGFADAQDYYRQASCLPVLPKIRLATLLINAQNDPFLTPSCFPHEVARESPWLHLMTPQQGGHVGFPCVSNPNAYWHEQQILDFMGDGN
jgi:uncharacterized protein